MSGNKTLTEIIFNPRLKIHTFSVVFHFIGTGHREGINQIMQQCHPFLLVFTVDLKIENSPELRYC